MKYALGNMLNGAGSLNPDGLSLDLQFAADKTLTARKGPTPVLTRGSTGTFVGSDGLIQSAAVNAPRFDHDPLTLACKGLLIEESRTNLILRSENFANASWTKTAGSISSVASVAPDGNANSELFSEDGTTASHRVFQSFAGTIGTVYTLSVFLKFNVRAEVSLENRSITGNPFAVFNIQNGTVGLVSPGLTAAIQAYPNGWYRCSITGTATLAGGNYLIAGYSVTGVYIGLNGPAFYIYGAQVEAGSFPTSYVPTTTASVVRSADVCSITGSGFSGFYNQPEGTLFADVTPPAVSQSACVLAVNVSTFFNQNGIYKNNAAFSGAGLRWGSTTVASVPIAEASIVTSTDVATSRSRLSYCYKLNDFALAYAGTIVGTDTSGVSPSPTTMHIGNRDGSLQINGHLASIRYYRKRLSNAKLQAITV